MKSAAIFRFQVLMGLIFIAAGITKLAGADVMVRQFEVIGLGQWLRPFAGTMEIVGGLSLCVPRTGAIGAALLAFIVLGSTGAMVGHAASAAAARHQTGQPEVTSARYREIGSPDRDLGIEDALRPRSPRDI
jgi:uncharacterized membrane protein YphA (DoxX/SURF4 family)